ncbi:hypothetical protein FGB62_17g219 [Gracilaria domingensis]|nr:hypothetical protein FGB62_17g219 [Gracilaria domingensis]
MAKGKPLSVAFFVVLLIVLLINQELHPLTRDFIPVTITSTSCSDSELHTTPKEDLERFASLSGPKMCIVYDRPPRTGSTTIGEALEKCLLPLGYETPLWRGFEARLDVIPDMVKLPYKRVAVVSRHFYMNATALLHLRSACKPLMYITSTAPMKQRLWSLVKYRQTQGHGNASLTSEQVQNGIEDLRTEKIQIPVLNRYPYIENESLPLFATDVEPVSPDYIIRKSHLMEDLSALVTALGCSSELSSRNVHESEYDRILDGIEIDDDDSLHTRLSSYAEHCNERGLTKASQFGL